MKYRKNYISLLISFIFKTQVAMYVPQTNLLFLHKIVNKCHKVQLKLNNSSKIKIHFYTWMHELKDVSEFSPILFFRMVWFLTIYSFKNKIKKTLQVSDLFFFFNQHMFVPKNGNLSFSVAVNLSRHVVNYMSGRLNKLSF